MGHQKDAVVYGFNAAMAVGLHRPQALRRVFYHPDRRMEVGPLLKACAAQRRAYREVGGEDLERLSKSRHHEGVVVFTEPLPLLSVDQLLDRMGATPLILALDGIGNPHNLGAILRSAAWFGAHGVIFSGVPGQGGLNGATLRVAQGGAEVLALCGPEDLSSALRVVAQAGIPVLGADQRGDPSLWDTGLRPPLCIVMGNEGQGLSAQTRRVLTGTVSIPGSGAVESLNVGVAAGVLLARAAHTLRKD